MIKLLFLISIIASASCAAHTTPIRAFNTKAFVGLVTQQITSYEDAKLDYELDTKEGQPIRFTSCPQVEASTEEKIASAQYQLFKLLAINCIALKKYAASQTAKQSFFPPHLSKKIIAQFPATATPRISDEDIQRREGKTLTQYSKALRIKMQPDQSATLIDKDNEINYVLLARADFDGDGFEDWLLRTDWHARHAMGKGTDLVLLSRKSKGGNILLVWRL